jgi:release factor glutamine methyltransferase
MDCTHDGLLTIRQTAKNTLSALLAIGIEQSEAHVEAQLILEHCLKLDLAQQITHGEETVAADKQACIDAICKQRSTRMPLQYCLGYAYFWGMKLAVKPGVFIPRSDTESLVQVTLKKIQNRAEPIKLIADIGTGSGAIAIALAKELPGINLVAVDASSQAIEQAKENANKLGVEKQIDFKLGHWTDVLPDHLDLIVSNPPYLNDLHRAFMQPEIIEYEPEAALFGADAGPGKEGLKFYEELANYAPKYMKSPGEILLEVGDGQSKAVAGIFKASGWKQIELHKDLNELDRVVSAKWE